MYILYIVLWVISLCSFNHLIQHKDYLACEKKGGTELGQWVLVKYRRVCVYNFALI